MREHAKNIVLMGLPGSGKTTLGRLLAQKLGRPFIDLDDAITAMAGAGVQQIFAGYGEDFFRELEARALRKACENTGCVLALGGGAVLRDDNLQTLAETGALVFIDRPVQAIAGDIRLSHRPLLKGGPDSLYQLAEARRARYLACAAYVLDNAGGIDEALEQLAAFAAPFYAEADYAVIGWPIGHSLSPAIHRAAFAARGLDTGYIAVAVPPEALPAFVAGARCAGLRGFNVTIPHKQAVMPLLDEIDPGARLCGAANTVVLRDGRLQGHNTDMEGLSLALEQASHGFAGWRVLLLGAGGAARATAVKAGLEGAQSLTIAARSAAKAKELAAHTARGTGLKAGVIPFESEALATAARGADLLINATPLGMAGIGEDFADLAFLKALPAGALVCDLIYNPPETTLLKTAKSLGLATQNGLDMLIFQALLAQQHFTGESLDMPALYRAVLAALQAGGHLP